MLKPWFLQDDLLSTDHLDAERIWLYFFFLMKIISSQYFPLFCALMLSMVKIVYSLIGLIETRACLNVWIPLAEIETIFYSPRIYFIHGLQALNLKC